MSKRFPIAYVAGSFPLRSETFVWREVLELRRRGWPVHTFGLRPPQEVPEELAEMRASTQYVYGGIGPPPPRMRLKTALPPALADALFSGERTSVRDRLKIPLQAGAGRKLAHVLTRLRVRHIHAHFAHAPTSVAMYAARYAGISFSFTGHANDLFQRRQLLKRKLQRASFVSCISEWHRDWYRSIHPDGDYRVIRCGVPVEQYGPPPQPAPGRLRVLCVARLVEKKGLELLIRAVESLPHVEVTIAGDGPERPHLEQLARASAGRVRFLGAVDPSRVADLLREHHAFALPCRPTASGDRDGIPVALMEAMAGGLPVVAGDLPAIRELVEPGRSGVLVASAGDEGVLRIRKILAAWADDAVERQRIGEAGQRRVREEFGVAMNIDRLQKGFFASVGG